MTTTALMSKWIKITLLRYITSAAKAVIVKNMLKGDFEHLSVKNKLDNKIIGEIVNVKLENNEIYIQILFFKDSFNAELLTEFNKNSSISLPVLI